MSTELDTFYRMVEDIEVAMMTTRRADGHMRSRAMATQKRASGAEFLEVNKPKPVVMYELVKGWITGKEPELGTMRGRVCERSEPSASTIRRTWRFRPSVSVISKCVYFWESRSRVTSAGRVGDPFGQLAVVDQEQQTRGVVVEPPHG